MKEIKLTQGKFTQVDNEDYLFLNKWKWHLTENGNVQYALTTFTDLNTNKVITIYMHRLIMGMPGTMEVDHKDHNGLNNQKSNLRVCTHRQNLLNASNRKNKKSKYLGVSMQKDGTIIAYVNINGKRKHVGTFKTEEEAARARDIALLDDTNVDFCIFNFPDMINIRLKEVKK
jgi:hypothetical protein